MKNNLKILIVDDENDFRLFLKELLVEQGHEIFMAAEGVGAIKLLLDNDIDVIISDYKMNILGGSYWMRFLEKFCPESEVIIVSGYLGNENKIQFPVLLKPVDTQKLESLLQAVMDKKDSVN